MKQKKGLEEWVNYCKKMLQLKIGESLLFAVGEKKFITIRASDDSFISELQDLK